MLKLKIFLTLVLIFAGSAAEPPECSAIIVHMPEERCEFSELRVEFHQMVKSRWYFSQVYSKSEQLPNTWVHVTEIKDDADLALLQESEKTAASIGLEILLTPKKTIVDGKWYIRIISTDSYIPFIQESDSMKYMWKQLSVIVSLTQIMAEFLENLHSRKFLMPDIEISDFIAHSNYQSEKQYVFHAVEKLVRFGTPFDPQSDFKKWDPARFDPAFSAPFDEADDIYNLGLVLARLTCSNCHIFSGDTLETFKSNVAKGDYTLSAEIPVEYMAIIHWALLADRKKRITMNEFSFLAREIQPEKVKRLKSDITLNNNAPIPDEILKIMDSDFKNIYLSNQEGRGNIFSKLPIQVPLENPSPNLIYYIGGGVLVILVFILVIWMACGRGAQTDALQIDNPNNAPLATTNELSGHADSGSKPSANIEIKN